MDVKTLSLQTYEDYLIALAVAVLSLKSLMGYHEQAIHLGTLKEDQECLANTILWDLKRLIALHQKQFDSVSELVPDDFDFNSMIKEIAENKLLEAKSVIKADKKAKKVEIV